jgi:hypothetical protein
MNAKCLVSGLLLIALPAQAATVPPKPVSCVTARELRAGLAFAMQEAVVALGSKCGPLLSETSYVRSKGRALVSRYADTASNSNDVLNGLIKRLAPELKIADGDPIAMKGIVSTLITAQLGKILSARTCEDVDRTLSLLDPMPAENMIGLVEFAFQKVDESDRRKGRRLGKPERTIICPSAGSTSPKIANPNSQDRH